MLTETAVTGARLRAPVHRADLGDHRRPPDAEEPLQLMEALSRSRTLTASARRRAAEAVTAALQPDLRTRAFVYNTLLPGQGDQGPAALLRPLARPAQPRQRGLRRVGEALIEAVVGRYELARRWYRLKARLLGIERLAHYDRMAPLAETEQRIPLRRGARAGARLLPQLLARARRHVLRSSSTATTSTPRRCRQARRRFCSYAVPSAHPYVMLNYTSLPGDVLTMAHELGHGVHASLARPKGLRVRTPLTVAETASIFGETIVLGRLLERADDAAARLAARRVARRRRRRGLPPGGDEPVRGPRARRAAHG